MSRLPSDRFSWGIEAPWILAVGASSVWARWPALQQPAPLFDSDNALGPIMARHIWRDEGYWPIMLDGQDYLGALDAYLGAPLEALFPHDPRAWVILQMSIMAAILIPILYWFLFQVGGRCAAVLGAASLALGSPWMLGITASAPLGYLTNLAIGLLILLVTSRCIRPMKVSWLFALGALVGLGWWNNPQIAVFVFASLLTLWSRGRLFELRARGELGRALSGHAGLAVRVLLGVGLAFFVGILVLPFFGEIEAGPISMKHPEKYLPRGVAVMVAVLVAVELYLTAHRRRWLRGAAALSVGMLAGVFPFVVYRIRDEATGVSPWMRFRLDDVPANLPDFLDESRQMLIGDPPTTSVGWALHVLAIGIVVGLAVAFLWSHRAALRELLALRATEVPPSLPGVLPGLLFSAVYLMRGSFLGGPRHYLALSVSLAVLVGWGVGVAVRRSRVGGAVLTMAILTLLIGDTTGFPAHIDRVSDPADRLLIEGLRAHGIHHGTGQYWVAFHVSYLTDEDPLIACDFDPMRNMHRFKRWSSIVASDPEPVIIFDQRWDGRNGWRERLWIRDNSRRVTERWRFGERYTVYRFRR